MIVQRWRISLIAVWIYPIGSGDAPGSTLLLEHSPRQPGLPNDRPQGADAQFVVVGNGHGRCPARSLFLHHHMAAALPDPNESVPGEDRAYFSSREDPQLTQLRRRGG